MSVFNESFVEPSCFFDLCNQGANGRISIPEQPTSQHQQNGIHVTAEDKQDKEELDALLSQAMNALTFEERQEQQEILHGVHQVVEDDDFIDRALQDLNRHLSSKKQEVQSAYEAAEQLDHGYVHDKDFRLMFLRANEYDPQKTGDQMLRHFDLKLRLFGEKKLTKDITLKDLDEGDIACLKAGPVHLAGRDRSGRQVFITLGGIMARNARSMSLQNQLRAHYYVMMRGLRPKETQLRGTVGIWIAMGDMRNEFNSKGSEYYELFRSGFALPQKRCAIHMCVDDMHQAILCKAIVKLMPGNLRARFKIHHGSEVECQYQLSSYGILKQSWPFDDNGKMKIQRHLDWVHRCAIEDGLSSQSSSSPLLINQGDAPSPNDVIFTNGFTRKHPGTAAFRNLVEEYAWDYDLGSEKEKRHIVDEITEKIHGKGGRFLGQTRSSSAVWEEVPHAQVRKKIMQTFRNRRRKKNSSYSGTLIADTPVANDVVFFRNYRNTGTDMLHHLIKNHMEEYESLERGKKGTLVESIMQDLIDHGARFLQPAEEPGKWFELSFDSARERISKYFQNQRRYLHPANAQKQT